MSAATQYTGTGLALVARPRGPGRTDTTKLPPLHFVGGWTVRECALVRRAVESRPDAEGRGTDEAVWVCLHVVLDVDDVERGGEAGEPLGSVEAARYLACVLGTDHVFQAPTAEGLARAITAGNRSDEAGQSRRGGIPPFRLRRVTEFVEDHLDVPIAVAEMAAEARMSEAHFARQFKHSVGETPLEYVTRCRVEAAKRLLAETELAVGEVGRRVGYGSASHFAEVFRRHAGVTPRAYRVSRAV